MRALGIDYGDKRIGLALAEKGSIAVPYKVISNDGLGKVFALIKEIIKSENIQVLVVGLPHSLSGHSNDRLSVTQDFINQLKSELSLPVDTVDEQYTSKLYSNMGVKKDLDKHAATAILDTWLNLKNNG